MSSNTKKLIILVIGILLFSCVLNTIFGLSGFKLGLFVKNTSHGEAKTFQVSGSFSDIDLESRSGSIRFYPSGDRSAKVVWSGNSAMKFSVRNTGNTLKVRESYKLPWFLRPGISSGRATIDIYLPQKDYDELKAESNTGSISVPAGFRFSSAEIETETGQAEFRSEVSETLKIQTDTGRITCAGSRLGNLIAESDTGAISLSEVRAAEDIKLETDTGKITLNRVIAADSMELESDTGSIELEDCDAEELEIETDTGSVRGTLLSEKTFSVRSNTGKIDIPESAPGGSCRIKTDTGSITIRIKEK